MIKNVFFIAGMFPGWDGRDGQQPDIFGTSRWQMALAILDTMDIHEIQPDVVTVNAAPPRGSSLQGKNYVEPWWKKTWFCCRCPTKSSYWKNILTWNWWFLEDWAPTWCQRQRFSGASSKLGDIPLYSDSCRIGLEIGLLTALRAHGHTAL